MSPVDDEHAPRHGGDALVPMRSSSERDRRVRREVREPAGLHGPVGANALDDQRVTGRPARSGTGAGHPADAWGNPDHAVAPEPRRAHGTGRPVPPSHRPAQAPEPPPPAPGRARRADGGGPAEPPPTPDRGQRRGAAERAATPVRPPVERPVRRTPPARAGGEPLKAPAGPPRRPPRSRADLDGPATDVHDHAVRPRHRAAEDDEPAAVPRGKSGDGPDDRTSDERRGGDRFPRAARPATRPAGARDTPAARRSHAQQADPTVDRPTTRRATRRDAAHAAAPTSTGRHSGIRRGRGPTVTRHGPRSLGSALLAALAATVVPGTGLLMIRRRRAGGLVLGVFLLATVALSIVALTAHRAALVQNLLSSRVLLVVMIGLVVTGLAWITQIVRTYALARPRGLDLGRRTIGVAVVAALCLVVATPFGYTANLVSSQRALLDNLFSGGGGTSVADAISKERLNVLLVGSDAGPDRTGARTDTMMLASIETNSARTTLFALPRNIGYARFPPESPMAKQFPRGFHDAANPLSGNYLLNAVYAWGLDHPQMAPTTPTANPGLNLLHQSVAYMLGIDIDYYVEVNMAGFASIIDAVGGVTVDVGPIPLPIGGVLPDGRHVKPSGYVPAGVQHLGGDQALWFARSRRDSDDYNRMGRQRCLLQSLLQQKSPTDVITHFQGIAAATKNSVATNIPQEVLGSLVSLASEKPLSLQSIAFDPSLPDRNEPDGRFNTSHVDVEYMRKVVQDAFVAPPASAPTPAATTEAAPVTSTRSARGAPTTAPVSEAATPASLSCG